MFFQKQIRLAGDECALLTAKQAATYLCISPKWLANQRWQKKGPKFLRVGGAIRYRVSDLEQFLEEAVVQPVGESLE